MIITMKTKQGDNMDYVTEIMPFLRGLVRRKKRYAINIIRQGDDTIVSILRGRRCRRFVNPSLSFLESSY